MSNEFSQFIDWFRAASPYIHVHRGKTFVIQFNDESIDGKLFTHLVHDLALLNGLGIRLVIVYGARHSIEAHLNAKNIASTYHKGMRVTDHDTIEYVKEVVGKLRFDIEAKFSMGLGNTPMSNAEVKISSGNYVTAKPLGIIEGVDYQFTGQVRSINVESIRSDLDQGEIVLVSPLGYSTTGEIFNLSADALAASLAVELNADKLVYLMNIDGLQGVTHKTVDQLTQLEAESLLQKIDESSDTWRYLNTSINVCKKGVQRVHLLNQVYDGVILQELFSRDGSGTMISASTYDDLRQANSDDISGIIELIAPLEQEGVLVERSREKLELEIDCFTIMIRDGVIIACAALFPFVKDKAAELACMVVHPDYHNGGRGMELLNEIEAQAQKLNIKKLFVLTTQAEHWFLETGFVESPIDVLPVERKELYNYQRNSKVLVKEL